MLSCMLAASLHARLSGRCNTRTFLSCKPTKYRFARVATADECRHCVATADQRRHYVGTADQGRDYPLLDPASDEDEESLSFPSLGCCHERVLCEGAVGKGGVDCRCRSESASFSSSPFPLWPWEAFSSSFTFWPWETVRSFSLSRFQLLLPLGASRFQVEQWYLVELRHRGLRVRDCWEVRVPWRWRLKGRLREQSRSRLGFLASRSTPSLLPWPWS